MKGIYISYLSVLLVGVLVACGTKSKKKDDNKNEFISIFNGENLEGWEGDPTYWRVENGILVGEVTPETILKRNSFIIYQKEQPENFELKLEYRVSESGNSGVNYRSEIIEGVPFALRGYQCDIDGKNKYTGQNYEEKKRTTLAYMGEKVNIPQMPDSIPKTNLRRNVKKNCWQTRKVVESLETIPQLKSYIKSNDWNRVHLKVNGNKMQHFVNGVLMSEVTDLDTINRSLKGYIGVQVHVGPPMKIEYKDIKLKVLK
ncbi:DUF1080 domain-containing protein [Hyunsoonleella sp. SJ7]|uniref:DUF1080 domain-containing protein n=1 Tax=Hyunsoonleella aquatilis TaxID=2762758 RepID=A0A923KM60_9FLAO|nr:DUF1080 domain-containing protein [Hyunsoonleella aquatilis]MBC3758690.1 DUF1080 domain-containing protein [Hyunsoonleella aquatilis]